MKHEATRQLFDYWNELRGARTAPERCDIDPAAIRDILADTFMLDVAETFPVRLAGTRAGALVAGEGPGGSFLDLWRPEERHNLAALLMAVADSGRPVVIGATGAPAGQADCAFEVLFLPLRHFGRTHARILAIVTAGTSPAWLGAKPMGPLALRSLRVIDPAETARPEVTPARRVAEARREAWWLRVPGARETPTVALEQLIRGRPALRLIEGGRAG